MITETSAANTVTGPAAGPASHEVTQALEHLYGSLAEPQATPRALEVLRRLFAVEHVALIFRSADRPAEISGVSICMDAPPGLFEQHYLSSFRTLDPLVHLPVEKPVAIQDLMDERTWAACDFYREFLAPMDVFHVMGVDIEAKPDLVCSLRLCRSRSGGRFSAAELTAFGELLPHIRQYLRLRVMLNEARAREQILDSMMERMKLGAVVLDAGAKIVHRVGSARSLLSGGRRFYVSAGELRAASPANDRKLQRLLQQAAEAAGRGSGEESRTVLFQDDGSGTTLGVAARTLTLASASGQQGTGTMVVFRDADCDLDISEENLRTLFELTPAEARLGRLLIRGLTIDEAAADLGVSRNTLRTHLRSLFFKTGTTRQAELVRALLGSFALLC